MVVNSRAVPELLGGPAQKRLGLVVVTKPEVDEAKRVEDPRVVGRQLTGPLRLRQRFLEIPPLGRVEPRDVVVRRWILLCQRPGLLVRLDRLTSLALLLVGRAESKVSPRRVGLEARGCTERFDGLGRVPALQLENAEDHVDV